MTSLFLELLGFVVLLLTGVTACLAALGCLVLCRLWLDRQFTLGERFWTTVVGGLSLVWASWLVALGYRFGLHCLGVGS